MTKPHVTVLIDTFNHERSIEQAILSVLNQTLPRSVYEVLVIDDGSTDNTPSIAQKFTPHVRYLRKENGGQASAFNAAIPEVQGSIVAFLDGDDWWASEKLRAVLDVFERNPDVAAVGHGYFEVYDDGEAHEAVVPERSCRLDLSSIDAARLADFGRTLLGTSRLAIRREILNQIGPIPEELVFCADTPILTLALALGGAVVLEQPLCYYRRHSGNLFAGFDDKKQACRKSQVLAFLLNLLPRRLAEFGVPPNVISSLLESDRIELKRLQLYFDGGARWCTFHTELQRFQLAYRNASPGYIMFKGLVLVLTLLLSPRRFYDLESWYTRLNLRRVRQIFGRADLAAPGTLVQRRPMIRVSTDITSHSADK